MSTVILEDRIICRTCGMYSSNGRAECGPCYGQRTGTLYDLGIGEYSLPAAIRTRYAEETAHLGKFEGEAPHVPYYYELALHGCGG